MKLTLAINLAATALAILVPGPTGPYSVAIKTLPLTDTSRLDPYAPKETPRRILVSAFLPVTDPKQCDHITAPYMSPAVAEACGEQAAQAGLPNTTFAMFDLELCGLRKQCIRHREKQQSFPLVLYSTGSGVSRQLYGARARSLASQGYAVVTIDHPYDALVVEFPDGQIIPASGIDDANTTQAEEAVQVRQADISFALSQLQAPETLSHLLANYPYSIDFSKTAAIGHSMGGASAASAVATDTRVLGGVNMDGGLFNPVLANGLSKPFMQIGRPNHRKEDKTWNVFWPRLRGVAAELAVAGTTHGSFPDTLTLLSAIDLPKSIWEVLEQEYGSIAPKDMDRDLNGALDALFQLLFKGNGDSLAAIHEHYSNITIVRSHLV